MTSGGSWSRRELLRDLAIAGAATGSLPLYASQRSVAMNQSKTLQAAAGAQITVDWRETYNGAVLESGSTDPDPTVPIVAISDAMPGDEGTVTFSVAVQGVDGDVSVSLVMDAAITDESEGIQTEPERSAGDDGTSGDLGAAIQAEAWYDSGPLGNCTGSLDVGNEVFASGSLRDVATTITGYDLVPPSGADCYGDGDAICLALHWWIPDSGASDNLFQGDSLTFDLQFGADPEC